MPKGIVNTLEWFKHICMINIICPLRHQRRIVNANFLPINDDFVGNDYPLILIDSAEG